SAHDNVILARESLTQTLGLKKDDRDLSGDLPVLDAQKLLANLSDVNFTERPDLKAKEFQTLSAEDQSAASHSFWFPKISIIGEYQWYNSPDYLFNSSTQSNYLKDNDNFRTAYFVGAAASWDILDGGTSLAKANEAGDRAKQARDDFEAAQLQAPYDFDLWKRRLVSSVTLYQAKLTDVEKAKESTRLATLGFKAGIHTTTDVLDAELEQFRAEAGLIQAQYNALEAKVNLELAIGKGIDHD
ncbi:MAG TPA: TolC family protein, partial [bacterium]